VDRNDAILAGLSALAGAGLGGVLTPSSRDKDGKKKKPSWGKRAVYAAGGGTAGGLGRSH